MAAFVALLSSTFLVFFASFFDFVLLRCGHLYFFSSFFGTWTFWVRYRCFLLKPYSYFCKTSVRNCRSWVPWRQKTREHLHGASVRSSAPWGSSDLQISERVGRMLFVNVSVCFTEFWWIFVGVWIDTWYKFFSVSLVLMNTTNFYRPTLLRRRALQQIASFWRLEKFFFSLLFNNQMSDAFLKEHRTMSWATHWEKRQKSEIGQDIFCVLILVLFIIVYSIWFWFCVWTVLYILLLNLFEMILNSHCWTLGWWRCVYRLFNDVLFVSLPWQGATRKKLELASGAILQCPQLHWWHGVLVKFQNCRYVGHVAFVAGDLKERKM